jgi:hypothetical protein
VLNHYRIYLQAYYVSDLATASGKNLSYHAWEGKPRDNGRTNQFSWPNQGPPSRADWDTGRRFLKHTILSRGLRLKTELGKWIRTDFDIWPWYFAPSLDSLIQIQTDGTALLHSRSISNLSGKNFVNIGNPIDNLPTILQKAFVKKSKKNSWRLLDIGDFTSTPMISHQETNLLHNADRLGLNPWCYEFLEIPSNCDRLMQEIEQGPIWLVSDGSFNPSMHTGTAAWILEGISSKVQISGKIITPGEPTDQSAYCSELAGILATVTAINFITTYYNVTGTITLHCDCEKGIEKAFNLNRIPTLQDSSHDILKAIH